MTNKKLERLVWTREQTWYVYVPHRTQSARSEERARERSKLSNRNKQNHLSKPSRENNQAVNRPVTVTFGAGGDQLATSSRLPFPDELIFPVQPLRVSVNDWRVSPLIGILTSTYHSKPGFRGNKANFSDIVQTGRRMGVLVFVFTPEGVDENTAQIEGYTHHPNGNQWVRCTFPWPHVVYNRIPDRLSEQRSAEQQALQLFSASSKTRLFNPSFFDKQRLVQWSEDDAFLQRYVPHTCEWGSEQTLADMLRQYPLVYVKPAHGHAGVGIMQVQQKGTQYRLTVVTGNAKQLKRYRTTSLKTLYKQIDALSRGKRYMIQQGIVLLRYDGCPFDLRALVQKNGNGQWTVTGVGIRIADAHGITTHVPRGGRIGAVKHVLPRVFGTAARSVYEQAVTTSVLIAERIEQQSGQMLGEMSLDLGLDLERRFWLFEANAKPMKFDEPHIRKRSLERLIQYADYLAKRGETVGHPRHSSTNAR